jgi:hypothetical protein
MFSQGPRRRKSYAGSLERRAFGARRSAFGVRRSAFGARRLVLSANWRGAALGRALKTCSNLLFHVQGQKVCTAGGSRERSKRVVCLFVRNELFEPTARQNTRWAVRGSRLFKKICGLTRIEANRARSLGRDSKRLPSSRPISPNPKRQTPNATSPLDRSPNAGYIPQARERFTLPRSG